MVVVSSSLLWCRSRCVDCVVVVVVDALLIVVVAVVVVVAVMVVMSSSHGDSTDRFCTFFTFSDGNPSRERGVGLVIGGYRSKSACISESGNS